MIIQYLSLVFNEVISLVGDTIDTGFANSLSLGVICVFSIISSIKILFYAIYNYGMYYFRLTGKRAKAGLYINIILSLLSSVLIIVGSRFVLYVFELEAQYQPLLLRCIRITFSFFVFEAISSYLRDYLIYSGKTSLCIKATFVYYIVMIMLDAVAVIVFKSAELILFFSGVCYLVFSLVLYFISGLSKEIYTKGDLLIVVKGGLPLFSNRLISKLCMFLLNIFASRLGTLNYAILSVARRSLEIGQTCMHPMVIMNIVNNRGLGLSYRKLIAKTKKVIVLSSFIFIVVTTIALFVIKGDLTYAQLLPLAIPVNIISMFAYIAWELVESKITADNMGSVLVGSGIVRLAVLLVLCLISLIDGIGIYFLIMYSFASDTLVALYGYKKSRTKVGV